VADQRHVLNLERIVWARADHNSRCPSPPHTVLMNPFDLERLGWDDGEEIVPGLTLRGDPGVQIDRLRFLCDRDSQAPSTEATEAVAREELLPA
jgi:hypothetical protein